MDIPRGMPNKIYNKCNNSEKLFLGFCSTPPINEFNGINTKADYSSLK